MNAAQLFSEFDRLSEAPDALTRLRQFVLELAVRGKLVPQEADDPPASELLDLIRLERGDSVNAGTITRDQPGASRGDNRPFEIPRNWTWAKLGDVVVKLTDGTHHSPPNSSDGDYMYVTAKNIKSDGLSLDGITYVTAAVHDEIYARCNPEEGDVLYVKDGATTGVVAINDLKVPFSMLSSVALLKLPSCVFNRLLVYFLRSPFFYDQMRGFMKGAALPRVTLKRMRPALLPLPPFAEQHRIVAKIDELMTLCDELEVAQAARESRRDRLVAASLHRASVAANADEFGRSVRFVTERPEAMFQRSEHVAALRTAILDAAVRGRLVPQNPTDEPASVLLDRIRDEIEALSARGTRGRRSASADIDGHTVPFDVPSGWEWTRLQSICSSVTDGDHQPPPKTEDGIPFLVIGNVRTRSIDFTDCRRVPPTYYEKLDSIHKPRPGDILYTLVGSYGIPILVEEDSPFCVQRHIGLLRPSAHIDSRFLTKVLDSDLVFTQATDCATGIAQKTVPLSGLRQILVPLPPVAEQGRIVAKVDELLSVCDDLERSLTAVQTGQSRLLDAVLDEALAYQPPHAPTRT